MSAAELTFTVTDDDTALALGSGSLPVLGTPRLLAWAEAATCAAVEAELAPGTTSVGTQVALEHRAPSSLGEQVRLRATVVHRDGRQLRFEVVAVDSMDRVVGRGEVTRVVVDGERFMARLAD